MAELNYVGMELCFYCQEPKSVLLDRRLKKTLPYGAVYNHEPCDACQDWMAQGIILISVVTGARGDNPIRTGGWVVVKDDVITRLVNDPALVAHILTQRWAYMPDDAWDRIGLPRGENWPQN